MNNSKRLPPILQYSRRAILWNCQEIGGSVFAGLAFFNRNLTAKHLRLTDRNGKPIVRVKTPEAFLNQSNFGRSQNIMLEVVEWL